MGNVECDMVGTLLRPDTTARNSINVISSKIIQIRKIIQNNQFRESYHPSKPWRKLSYKMTRSRQHHRRGHLKKLPFRLLYASFTLLSSSFTSNNVVAEVATDESLQKTAVVEFKKNFVNVAKCDDANIGSNGSYWWVWCLGRSFWIWRWRVQFEILLERKCHAVRELLCCNRIYRISEKLSDVRF